VVGGAHGGRGVVTTASYECRVYGVHSGMSAADARRLCPDAIFVGVNAKQYMHVSRRLREIFAEYAPRVESVSVDEAFLDLTGCAGLFGGEESLARRLKDQIRRELSLTCSVGIAPNKIIAKLASSVFKPDGLTVIHRADIPRIVYPLPVGKLWGVGPVAERSLNNLGIRTVGDLACADTRLLRSHLGLHGEIMGRVARGEDASPVVGHDDRPRAKSIGHEQTFSDGSSDRVHLRAILWELSERVARRMRRAGLAGRTITVKIRYADFQTFTRRCSVETPTNAAERIAKVAAGIFDQNHDGRTRIRLLGVSVSSLMGAGPDHHAPGDPVQSDLFAHCIPSTSIDTRRDLLLDQIRDRFGEHAIVGGFAHRKNTQART